jgi:DNA (cytosine-5)-methyltransferase 1
LKGGQLDILYATPPCQGMSKNGRGTILNNIRKGTRPQTDDRNRLIIPVMEIAKALRPRLLLLENVPEMENTLIETPSGDFKMILEYVREELGEVYMGRGEVVEFADFGVPQKRQRLISVFSSDPACQDYFSVVGSFISENTHAAQPTYGKKRWQTVRDAIAHLPKLDAQNLKSASSGILFHHVPLLDDEKYFWVSNTPPERSAFDNQCVKCGFDKNPTHGIQRTEEGINRARKDTPIRCLQCNAVLPRPWVTEDGEYRLMNGFTSAYKRMRWDAPANALTTNLSYACSDSKLHPEQNRVLSLHEAFIIHTIAEYDYYWKRADGKPLSNKSIREIIGESIPPKGLEPIVALLCDLLNGKKIEEMTFVQPYNIQLQLFTVQDSAG